MKKEDSSCPVDGNVNLQPVWESEGVLQKVKIDMPCNPTVLLPGIYPDKTIIQKNIHPLFIAALFTIAKTWTQAKCPLTDKWTKICYIYTHTHTHKGILLSH